jgi:DNA ligase 1
MMNSEEILDVIEQIAADPSKKGKEALIAKYIGDAGFKRVLIAAYDPFVTYGIAKVPTDITSGGYEFTEDTTWTALSELAARNITGNAARDVVAVELSLLRAKSQELFRRILTKDLRAGFTENTINRAAPGTIVTFDCMLAHPIKKYEHKIQWPALAQVKLDGVRVLAFVDLSFDSVKFFSRSGKEFTTFEHMAPPIILAFRTWLNDSDSPELQWVMDGEVVSGSFNKTVSEVRRKNEAALDAKFFAFDLIPTWAFQKDVAQPYEVEYKSRAASLLLLREAATDVPRCPLRVLPSVPVNDIGQVHRMFESVRSSGYEGLIIKDPDGYYHRKRNAAWLKVKAEESVDVVVTGAFEGQGKYLGMLGGLLADFNGVEVSIGGGFSDEQRKAFWYAWNNPGVQNEYDITRDLLEGRLIEVEYHEVTPDGSLRHPRFKGFRDDKPARDGVGC